MVNVNARGDNRCLNCRLTLESPYEDYCSKACEYEHRFEEQNMCKRCRGSGRSGAENAKGEWIECRACKGTGYKGDY